MTTLQNRPAPSDRFRYVTPNDVFAGLANDGSISVEEWPGGRMPDVAGKDGVILVCVEQDIVGGAPMDTVSVHPDESDRLVLISRAIEALENARAALLAVGYVDYADRRETL